MLPRTQGRLAVPPAIAAAVLCLLALPGFASAQTPTPEVTKKVTVPGEVVFRNGQRPGDPGNCSAVTFVRWADVPGTVRATAFYIWRGQERSESREAPFNDTYEWVATYVVDPGHHWIQIGQSWADGPRPNDCSEMVTRGRPSYDTTAARVELSVDNTATCKKTRTALAKARANLKKARARLRKAKSSKAKQRARTSVKKHQAKVKKAGSAQRKECTSA